LGICLAGATISFSKQKTKTLLDNGQASVFNALQKAQNQAVSGVTGVGNGKYGVHIESDKVVIFEGDSYLPGSGEEIGLPTPLFTDQNNLDIIFNRISGKPNFLGNKTIIISHPNGLTDKVEISDSGVISTP
jgi:hypothetical protein